MRCQEAGGGRRGRVLFGRPPGQPFQGGRPRRLSDCPRPAPARTAVGVRALRQKLASRPWSLGVLRVCPAPAFRQKASTCVGKMGAALLGKLNKGGRPCRPTRFSRRCGRRRPNRFADVQSSLARSKQANEMLKQAVRERCSDLFAVDYSYCCKTVRQVGQTQTNEGIAL